MTDDRTTVPVKIPMKSGGSLAPIIPETFEDVQRLARIAVQSGLFRSPDQGDTALAQATMAIMKGLEVGIQPMQALENISIINGRSQIWGDMIPALIWSNGHKIEEDFISGQKDEMVARCRITRGDNGVVIERTFSVSDAREAKLWGKSGPWTAYPKRMLQMRARGFCARDAIPDVLKGMVLREEMAEIEERGTIVDAAFVPPPPPPSSDDLAKKLANTEPAEIVWDDDGEILK